MLRAIALFYSIFKEWETQSTQSFDRYGNNQTKPLIVPAYSTNPVGVLGIMNEEESNQCGKGCGSQSLKRVCGLSDTYGIFHSREWLLNYGLDKHPLLRWEQFCLHGIGLPSKQPQMIPLLLCIHVAKTWSLSDTQGIIHHQKLDCDQILNKSL